MIQTGRLFEEIVDMLTRFRQEVETSSSLGLLNINRHAENFVKRILNLTYKYELENLNKNRSNFPGLDLGDTGEGVAYQITATKKSEKIDDALQTCLKYEHYTTFQTIKIFILTRKQSSYTLKTVTEPYFSFSSATNIQDFDDLFKEIQNIDPIPMRGLHEYIKSELTSVIESVQGKETEIQQFFLDVNKAMTQSQMPNYYAFQAKISIQAEKMSVPSIHSRLTSFINNPILKMKYFPVFNESYRKSPSHQQILYLKNPQPTNIANFFHGYALLLEPSSITFEKADYADNEFLVNLTAELFALLTYILFFSKYAQSKYVLDVSIHLKSNNAVYLAGQDSLIIRGLLSNFTLNSPYYFAQSLTKVDTSTLTDLVQQIVHGFMTVESDRFGIGPFVDIDREKTEWHINQIKNELGINDISVY